MILRPTSYGRKYIANYGLGLWMVIYQVFIPKTGYDRGH